MACFSLRGVWRRTLALVAAAALVGTTGLILSACSRDPEAAQVGADSPISVEVSSLSLTIANKSGGALVALEMAIVSAGGTPFTQLVSRIESGEKREISLNDFSSRDGTRFNLRMVRPKTVRVKAKDVFGKEYAVQVPWK